MAKIKKQLARKAAKLTAGHTAHGTASKLKREPVRNATLLGIGCATGAIVGWVVARLSTSPAPASRSSGASPA